MASRYACTRFHRIGRMSCSLSVDFTAVVYENTEKFSHEGYHTKPAQRITLYYELMVFMILIPGVMFIVALLWVKQKPKISSDQGERKSSPI